MHHLTYPAQLRALALMGFALIGPVALPAGGADLRVPEIRRRQSCTEPLSAPVAIALRCSPQHHAPIIAEAAPGSPLRLLRSWTGITGHQWLHVEIASNVSDTVSMTRNFRGWLLGCEKF